MTVRFIGGLWRRIDGSSVKSYPSYQDAVEGKTSWEDLEPQTTSDDILHQLQKQS